MKKTSYPHKWIALALALVLLGVAGVRHWEEQPKVVQDAVSGATPFSKEEGRTGGVKSSAQSKAEGGAVNVTQSRIRDAAVFQQVEGHDWRTLRNGPVTFYGGWLLAIIPLGIYGFYALFGPLRVQGKLTGKLLQRFSKKEQHIHWGTAISFVVLALSGGVILFGKHLLLPVVGYQAFSWIAVIAKNMHNLAGPLFVVCVVLMVRHYVRDNLFKKIDLQWVLQAHHILAGQVHVPSYKYNFGEKVWFWGGVVTLGLLVSASGLVLDFPVFNQGRHVMQAANLVHVIGALLFIAVGLGHIYMGTIGADGALQAMKTGMVDETWAKEHHELWYEEEKANKVAL